MTLPRAIARSGREQVSLDYLLAAGVPRATVARAVARGKLRAGIDGYWLPRAADPGALLIFRSAMSERVSETETN